MIPLKDYNPTRRPAIVVPIFVAINAAVFLFVQPTFSNDRAEEVTFFACQAAIPAEVTSGDALAETDSESLTARAERLRCPQKNVWLSILTSMFLHGGWLHILGNMLFLWVFGNNVEDALGRVRFVLFYVLAGAVAVYAHALVDPDSTTPMIGASGAIAGILGAYLLLFPRARIRTLVLFIFITVMDLPAVLVLGAWFLLQVFQQVGDVAGSSGVAYMAHIGGFIAGMVLLKIFGARRTPRAPEVPY